MGLSPRGGKPTKVVIVYPAGKASRSFYVKKPGQLNHSYGSPERLNGSDKWSPWCFDCKVSLPEVDGRRPAAQALIDHRREAHGEFLVLTRKLNPFRAY
jgi:hypothetical protein